MIEIKMSFATVDLAFAALSKLQGAATALPSIEGAAQGEQPAPAQRRARKPKEEAAPQTATVVVPTTQPDAATLFGSVQQAPAPVAQPKPTQVHLIAAFRNLANAKGTDPIVALLAEFKAKSVATIAESDWQSAIEKAAIAGGFTYAAAIVPPKS